MEVFLNLSGDLPKIGVINPEKMRRKSTTHGGIRNAIQFDEAGNPIYSGHLDPRQGPVDFFSRCQTCLGTMYECNGHFGHIEFARPIFRAKYFYWILKILHCICFRCYRLLISPKDSRVHFILKTTSLNEPDMRLMVLASVCEGIKFCDGGKHDLKKNSYAVPTRIRLPYRTYRGCGAFQPRIWISGFDLMAKWKFPNSPNEIGKRILTPEQVRNILMRISDEDYAIMGFDVKVIHPIWFILTMLPVPPVFGYPSLNLTRFGKDYDEMIKKVCIIIHLNNKVIQYDESTSQNEESDLILNQTLRSLQFQVARLFDDFPKIETSNEIGSSLDSIGRVHEMYTLPSQAKSYHTSSSSSSSVRCSSLSTVDLDDGPLSPRSMDSSMTALIEYSALSPSYSPLSSPSNSSLIAELYSSLASPSHNPSNDHSDDYPTSDFY